MSNLKIFKLKNNNIEELIAEPVAKEKNIQYLIEKNSEALLNIRFIKSEHTFKADDGRDARIDTLGIDENNTPVIIEYKKDSKDTVMNQGLFYMDWLLKHKKDFEWLVMEKFDRKVADKIDWSYPRVLCIANDFSRYDSFAVNIIPTNIELYRYKVYQNELLLLELINRSSNENVSNCKDNQSIINTSNTRTVKTVSEKLEASSDEVKYLYKILDEFLLSLGDEDVQKNVLMHYIAYRKIKNFAAVQFRQNQILIYINVNPDKIELDNTFLRDVRQIGHYGTGHLEIAIKNASDIEKAKKYIEMSFNNS